MIFQSISELGHTLECREARDGIQSRAARDRLVEALNPTMISMRRYRPVVTVDDPLQMESLISVPSYAFRLCSRLLSRYKAL